MNISQMMQTIIRSEEHLAKHKKLINDKTLYDEKHQAIYQKQTKSYEVEFDGFKEEVYYVSPMIRRLSEDSRMRYYNLKKDLSKMDDLVKYMKHKADVAMDHSNSIFQAQVKKNGYILGNCRRVGKGRGISFPDGIWNIIKSFAIPDCAVPPVLSKNFRINNLYQYYCKYNKRLEGPLYRFCGYTGSGLGKFRKTGSDTIKRVRLTRKPACPKMPDDFTNNNILNRVPNYNNRFEVTSHVMFGTAYKFLEVYCKNGGGLFVWRTNSGYSDIWEKDCAWGQELEDLRKICYINYAADDLRNNMRDVMDYSAGRTILDVFDKNNLKTYWIEIINRNIAEIKRRYLWLYKKGNGDELDACNYENNREYWDYVFINKYIKIAQKGWQWDDTYMNRIGLTDEDRRIKALNHHTMRDEGNRIGKIFSKYLIKINDRKRKYCRQQTNIQTIQLAAKGAVTDFFDDNELSACM